MGYIVQVVATIADAETHPRGGKIQFGAHAILSEDFENEESARERLRQLVDLFEPDSLIHHAE